MVTWFTRQTEEAAVQEHALFSNMHCSGTCAVFMNVHCSGTCTVQEHTLFRNMHCSGTCTVQEQAVYTDMHCSGTCSIQDHAVFRIMQCSGTWSFPEQAVFRSTQYFPWHTKTESCSHNSKICARKKRIFFEITWRARPGKRHAAAHPSACHEHHKNVSSLI